MNFQNIKDITLLCDLLKIGKNYRNISAKKDKKVISQLRGQIPDPRRKHSPNIEKKVDWVSGACILTKKEYYNKINGFDEGVFMYMDEVDLLYRASLKGLNTYFFPEAKLIFELFLKHKGGLASRVRNF